MAHVPIGWVERGRCLDNRWRQVAKVLVEYSTKVEAGERVMIAMTEVVTLPLVRAVYEEAVKAGAHVQVQFLSSHLQHSLMRYGTLEQISWVPEIEAYGMDWADVYIGLRGAPNPFEFADIAPPLLVAQRRALGQISTARWLKTRWCLVPVPSEALAQQAEVDLETLSELFFRAVICDWGKQAQRWGEIADVLNAGEQVHLTAPGTDLHFATSGRRWIVGDGRVNMPDGEIYTAPVEGTLSGHIYFELPGVLDGRLVRDIRLQWSDGRLVDASASSNEELLHDVLKMDAGASLLGEFAVGTNYGIDLFCRHTLLDEKIGGTMHIALGRAYSECGGTNQSAIHWDIVKDTRTDSQLSLDGRSVFENGQFLI
jgi:aminopeptidase